MLKLYIYIYTVYIVIISFFRFKDLKNLKFVFIINENHKGFKKIIIYIFEINILII
jgi:hypothetical protein